MKSATFTTIVRGGEALMAITKPVWLSLAPETACFGGL